MNIAKIARLRWSSNKNDVLDSRLSFFPLERGSIVEKMHTWSRHHIVTLIGCNAKGEGYNEPRPRKEVHPSYLLQRVTSAGRCPRPPHSNIRGGYWVWGTPYGFPWETSQRSIDLVHLLHDLFPFSLSLSSSLFLFYFLSESNVIAKWKFHIIHFQI